MHEVYKNTHSKIFLKKQKDSQETDVNKTSAKADSQYNSS